MANKRIALNTKSRKLVMHETMTGYAFMLPFLIFFAMFVLYPMFMCVYTSFFDATMGRADIFVGFGNYKTLFQDKVFWIAGFRARHLRILPVGCLRHQQDARDSHLSIPLHLLSACGHRLRGRHHGVEVDVQQLLRYLQLPGHQPWPAG